MAIGNHPLRLVLSFCVGERPRHDLSTGEVLPDLIPQLAPKAVNVRKLYRVFSTNDVGAGERVLRCRPSTRRSRKMRIRSEVDAADN